MKHIKVFENFVPEELNEISSETIKSATDISIAQGQPGRAAELLKTHFYNYMGKPFQNGILSDIKVNSTYDQSSISSIRVVYTDTNRLKDEPENRYFTYIVGEDLWKLSGRQVSKREARLLSEIATIMNPQTKYKIATQNLPIQGYGMQMGGNDW
jgi:hypothetical protein